jgi:hypothetical protein
MRSRRFKLKGKSEPFELYGIGWDKTKLREAAQVIRDRGWYARVIPTKKDKDVGMQRYGVFIRPNRFKSLSPEVLPTVTVALDRKTWTPYHPSIPHQATHIGQSLGWSWGMDPNKSASTTIFNRKKTMLRCPRCGITQEHRITAGGAQQRCSCSRSLTMRHEILAPIKLYHGTDINFEEFNDDYLIGGSAWFTSNKAKADSGYEGARGKGVVIKREFDEGELNLATPDDEDKYLRAQLESMGYDGIKYPGEDDDVYEIWNYRKLRKFNKKKTPELSGLRRNIMGTTSFTLKGGSMRKPQEFIIYPKNENDGLPPYIFQIQSDTRIGLIDMKNGGRMLAAPPVSSGAYFVHLQFALDNKTAQSLGTLEKSDYEALFDAIGATANTWGDRTEVITTDNTGAGLDFLNSVKDSGLE